ncbi:hypothetical protein KAT80_00940 [Candidatus Pacearchaeota archaeon]|nr:hypothetical protein [Candidatus Pacearchaeota archaeon]
MDLKYSLIGRITLEQEGKIMRAISRSKKFEIADELPDGKLNHIVKKGTTTPVGYIGNETFERVNPEDEKLKPDHNFLEGIYKIITNAERVS